MAPLSRELSGLILPYDHFGSKSSDLDESTNNDLELKNFEHAGNILCEIWSRMSIDGHSVHSEYISPSNQSTSSAELPNSDWYCRHVYESQYCLQVCR